MTTDITANTAGVTCTELLIQGVHCSACSRLIEDRIGGLAGVASISVNPQSGLAQLDWRPATIDLHDVLQRLKELGFTPHPLERDGAAQSHKDERNALLKRLAVAGVGMMQVMMYAIGTYFGAASGMQPAIEKLLFFASMLIATPVVFYAGAGFLRGAWQSLRAGQPSMDVPIALALLLAYTASCVNYFRGAGQMYFESATMFVFLLLCARLITLQVRHRAIDASLALLPLLPDLVIRIESGVDRPVPRAALSIDDLIRIRPGDAVGADGVIAAGTTSVDESLLTGESEPRARGIGDNVLAGSINYDGTIEVRVTATAQATRIAQMAALMARAQHERPRRVQLANRVAGYFVSGVLTLACAVFTFWWHVEPSQAFAATLAVLVVTCPCALALAVPTALSAAATRLARSGLLLSRLDALEDLANVDLAIFDKTGTLSAGKPTIGEIDVNTAHPLPLDASRLIELVATVEKHSNHPLARAFAELAGDTPVSKVKIVAGQGIAAQTPIRNLKIGNAGFVGLQVDAGATIYVTDQYGLLGQINVTDRWRVDAATTVSGLAARGIPSRILSGDRQCRVDEAVTALHMDDGRGEMLPEQKLAELRRAQRKTKRVLAVGDGVNDAGLLAGADVSVALAGGADLAQAGADVVLTGERLLPLTDLIDTARRTQRIIRQNLGWAIGYNLIAVPLAALGMIGPGLAALGMSVSSLVVVLNAARLAGAPAKPVRPQLPPTDIHTDALA